ncbi:hypothetical protein M2451_001737 [Dysgonomonas sp. PFB1-18]|nr:hypothetical protein [Dysgonomonas sp. PF1-14]MDH6338954.1 hypothetical protein [Dysgonomonas sp. PF1-16]MDH6380415.1 hypothetical protein [Dysgonomonas sp. PFB1-18]MDH6397782.1 hypothetical protein [Dysgonomonas sp. PF1-23]
MQVDSLFCNVSLIYDWSLDQEFLPMEMSSMIGEESMLRDILLIPRKD